jgi:hypothetical protein
MQLRRVQVEREQLLWGCRHRVHGAMRLRPVGRAKVRETRLLDRSSRPPVCRRRSTGAQFKGRQLGLFDLSSRA